MLDARKVESTLDIPEARLHGPRLKRFDGIAALEAADQHQEESR